MPRKYKFKSDLDEADSTALDDLVAHSRRSIIATAGRPTTLPLQSLQSLEILHEHVSASSSSSSSEDDSEHDGGGIDEQLDPEGYAIYKALSDLPLFDGCGKAMLQALAEQSERRELAVGTLVDLSAEDSLLVVLSGVLQVYVNTGPWAEHGPGNALNCVGMLGLIATAEPFHSGQGHALETDDKDLMAAQQGRADRAALQRLESATCMKNLCPHAAKNPGFERLTVRCGEPGSTTHLAFERSGPEAMEGSCESPELSRTLSRRRDPARLSSQAVHLGERRESEQKDTVLLAAVSAELVRDILAISDPKAVKTFHKNRNALVDRWLVLLRHFVFPGVPPEVSWALAEQSERIIVHSGDLLAREGEVGDKAETMFVLESGEAAVEKMAWSAQEHVALGVHVGDLKTGCIIGDACFLGTHVPRAATVRAQTYLEVLRIPPQGLLQVLHRFPGTISCCHNQVHENARFVERSAPPHKEILAALRIFSQCGASFIGSLANCAECRIAYCGDVLKDEGDSDTTLYVVEFGAFSVETRKNGRINVVHHGEVFGERTMLGWYNKANATIRVISTFALLLAVPQKAFDAMLDRYPDERRRFERMMQDEACPRGLNRGHELKVLQLFSACSMSFIEDLGRVLEDRYYKPGMTITVEGAVDDQELYIIKSGQVAIHCDNKHVRKLGPGSIFGELTMLGIVRRRTATVCCLTLCFVKAIPRAQFLQILERHPTERDHFEDLTMRHKQQVTCVHWPFFVEAPQPILYLVNLYAERHITAIGDWVSQAGKPLERGAAVLLLQGTIALIDDAGKEKARFTEGQCFNEQVLLGFPPTHGKFVPTVTCEVQIMTQEAFDKVMLDFTNLKKDVAERITMEMAEKAEETLGFQRSNCGVLSISALFRAVPDSFNELFRPLLEQRVFDPGEWVMREGAKGDRLFILLSGKVVVEEGSTRGGTILYTHRPVEGDLCSRLFGESILVGISTVYPSSVRTETLCLFHVLRRSHLVEILRQRPEELSRLRSLRASYEKQNEGMSLLQKLQKVSILSGASSQFLSMACLHAEDVFFAPAEAILRKGDPCSIGETSIYVLMSAEPAHVEGENGIEIGRVSPGDVFGEGGAVGLAPTRSATIRSSKECVTHCIRLQGRSIKAAIEAYPAQHQRLKSMYEERQNANADFETRRRNWLKDIVEPALKTCPLLAELPANCVDMLTLTLSETRYASGEEITTLGEPADSMMLLLRGNMTIHAKSGRVVGHLTQGAIVGEDSVLGILAIRLATLCAASECFVLHVPAHVISDVLASPDAEKARKAVERLREERWEQLHRGMPMCALDIGGSPEHVCVKALSLRAERIDLKPGETWQPVADTCPKGPHFGVMAAGRAVLVMGQEKRPLLTLLPGSLLPEGLAAEFGAHVRAVTSCEAYRVCMSDFLLAASTLPSSYQWYLRFEGLWKAAQEKAKTRLETEKGLTSLPIRSEAWKSIHELPAHRRPGYSRSMWSSAFSGSSASMSMTSSIPKLGARPSSRSSMGIGLLDDPRPASSGSFCRAGASEPDLTRPSLPRGCGASTRKSVKKESEIFVAMRKKGSFTGRGAALILAGDPGEPIHQRPASRVSSSQVQSLQARYSSQQLINAYEQRHLPPIATADQ